MERTGTAGVHDVLVEQAGRHPDKDAFVTIDADGLRRSTTYRTFVAEVERTAVVLHRAGVEQGDAAVVHLVTSLEFLTCWFALLRLGAPAVPTNLASPALEVVHAMTTAGATHVITEPRSTRCSTRSPSTAMWPSTPGSPPRVVPPTCPRVRWTSRN